MLRLLTVLGFLFLLTTCSTSEEDPFAEFGLEGTEISMNDISGLWGSISAVYETTTVNVPIQSVNIVPDGGSIRLNIFPSGSFRIDQIFPGGIPEVFTGRMRFDERSLVISLDSDPSDFGFFGIEYKEPTMQITGTLEEAYDFDGDGVREEAFINFLFRRIE